MGNKLDEFIMGTQKSAVPVASDILTSLAKRAADAYVGSKTPLLTSIGEMVKLHSLNDEQAKRLCEQANRATYLALFEANPADDKAVDFPMVDYNELTQPIQKTASLKSLSLDLLPDDYTPTRRPMIKEASIITSPADISMERRKLYSQWRDVHSRLETVMGKYAVSAAQLTEKKAAFNAELKSTLQDAGVNVLGALRAVLGGYDVIVGHIEPDLMKTAAANDNDSVPGVPNQQHPIFRKAASLLMTHLETERLFAEKTALESEYNLLNDKVLDIVREERPPVRDREISA